MLWCYVSIDHLKKQKLPTHFVGNLKMCRFADNLRLYICLDPQIALFPAQFPSRRQKKMLQVCYIFKTSSGPISRIELSVQKIFRESESVGAILRGWEMLSPIPRKMSISFYFPQSWEKLLAFTYFLAHKELHNLGRYNSMAKGSECEVNAVECSAVDQRRKMKTVHLDILTQLFTELQGAWMSTGSKTRTLQFPTRLFPLFSLFWSVHLTSQVSERALYRWVRFPNCQ